MQVNLQTELVLLALMGTIVKSIQGRDVVLEGREINSKER